MGTVLPGVIAFVVGVVLAVGALVPWTAWEYRRHGQLGFRRSLVAFGTLVYALALVTYTLLPLPDDVATMCRNAASPQLTPFAFLGDVAKEGGISGPRSLLSNPASAQVLFNVLLFVPLGALARHAVARRRVFAGLLVGLGAGFVVSLLIETTQLTGDWFLYPCSYRLFDVDDLLANTTGAAVGTFLAPLVGLLAGSGRTTDADAPRPVTAARRFSGLLADVLAIWLLSGTLSVGTALVWAIAGRDDQDPVLGTLITAGALVAPFAQLVVVLATGRTLGEHVVRLRPVPTPGTGRRVVRWALGSGGWAALLALDVPFSAFLAFVLAVTSVIAVWATRGRRGFALAVIRAEVEDDRVPARVG
ncbi:glycopeptide antibiotics resistance protein [Curtobacterium sp. 320]|uniref:VanZ family protein n=1 Tax=Curtobacterium sp. 320 TaxID=2817749 RepID=UPI00285E20FE|nr:VanZ family protein [Curtobacterium sp. 320]MDR6573369.1 glycopeptide antibiotics resistance protein [Curtobacterium sp. 320]